jgi:UrcA family protein
MSIKTIIAITAAFTAATLTVSPALASANGSDVATTDVRTADLDLSQSADQRRLSDRIARAARSVCSTGVRSLAARAIEGECVALAINAAQPDAQQAIARASGGTRLATIRINTPG